ncbi:hypothetical protein D3C84_918690 [compost metagenome]
MNRCAHLVHGRGHLIGFILLLRYPDLGLLADLSQLFNRCRQLADTLVNSSDQFAQAEGHGLHAVLQLAQFVAPLDRFGQLQVALGNACSQRQGLLEWGGDLSGNQPGRQHAQH